MGAFRLDQEAVHRKPLPLLISVLLLFLIQVAQGQEPGRFRPTPPPSTTGPTTAPADNPTTAQEDDSTTDQAAEVSVIDVLAIHAETQNLLELLNEAGLTDLLRGDGPFTMFAPTNDVLDSVDMTKLETAEYQPHYFDLLMYHVAPELVLSKDLVFYQGPQMLNGQTINITSLDPIMINDGAAIAVPDILSDNGIVHFIDAVLLPPSYTMNAVTAAVADPQLSILVELLTAADLLDTLAEEGPFTIFAPTNAAFEKLEEGVSTALMMEENKEMLVNTLTRHVVPGIWVAEELVDEMPFIMLNGDIATIGLDPTPMVDNATIVETDILVNNGVIHIIDTVLGLESTTPSPFSTQTLAPTPGPDGQPLSPTAANPNSTSMPTSGEDSIPATPATSPAPTGQVADVSVVDLMDIHAETTTLLEKLSEAALTDLLGGEGPFSVFAPSNNAFDSVDLTKLETEEFHPHFVDLLAYHVAPQLVLSSGLVFYEGPEMLNGHTINITSLDPTMINFESTISTADLMADNGIVHFIDAVLLPPSYTMDAVTAAVVDPDLSILVELLAAADLLDTLSEDGPFTIFAPSNEAFQRLGEEASSIQENTDLLVDVLTQHVTKGVWVANELEDGMSFTMLNDGTSVISLDPSLMIDGASIIETDRLVNNGVIHVIDRVLGFEDVTPSTPAPTPLQPETDELMPPRPLSGTVWDILVEESDLLMFQLGLQSVNIDMLLSMSDMNFTVFAPSNAAVLTDPSLLFYSENIEKWAGHATNAMQSHIVPGKYILIDALWDGLFGDTLDTLSGRPLAVDISEQQVGGQNIAMSDLLAFNGVVHTLEGLLNKGRLGFTLIEVLEGLSPLAVEQRRLQSSGEFGVLIQNLDDRIPEMREQLALLTVDGMTLVAPWDAAFSEADEDDLNDDFLLYHVIQSNVYQETADWTQQLMPTGHPEADVWATIDSDGIMRYNDIVVQSEWFAENGVIHVTETVLDPPTMVRMLEVTNSVTSYNVSLLHDFFVGAGWDMNKLSSYVGTEQGERFTLLAPSDGTFETYLNSEEERERLLTPLWSRHLEDLLLNLVASTPYTKSDIQELTGESGGYYGLEMVGGSIYNIYSADFIGPGSFLDDAPNCVDGVIHFVDGINLPSSVSGGVYDILLMGNQSTLEFERLLASSDFFLWELVDSAPLTLLVPTDSAFDSQTTQMTQDEFDELLTNHAFEDILFTDQLAEMAGDTITSMAGIDWVVEVDGQSLFLGNDVLGARVRIETTSNDFLMKNGVTHFVDMLLMEGQSPTQAPSASSEFPTTTPTQVPSAWSEFPTTTPTQAPSASSEFPTTTPTQSMIATSTPTTDSDGSGSVAPSVSTDASTEPGADPTQVPSSPPPNAQPTMSQVPSGPSPNTQPTMMPSRSDVVGSKPPTGAPAGAESPTTLRPTDLDQSSKPQPLLVKTSFGVFNQKDLKAEDLATAENVGTLNTAFNDFMTSLVAEVEGQRRRLLSPLLALRSRRLTVSLVPDSSKMYGVAETECSKNEPKDATCQMVFAQYELNVQDEDNAAVEKRYEAATQGAIEQGKLQQNFDQTDPTYPFRVMAMSSEPQKANDKMAWWVILLIVLACVFGCAGLGCIGAYFSARSKEGTAKRNMEEIEAPLLETSVQLVNDNSDQPKPISETSSVRPPTDQTDENPEQFSNDEMGSKDNSSCKDDERSVEVVEQEDPEGVAKAMEKADESTYSEGDNESWEDDGELEDGDKPATNKNFYSTEITRDDLSDGNVDDESWEDGNEPGAALESESDESMDQKQNQPVHIKDPQTESEDPTAAMDAPTAMTQSEEAVGEDEDMEDAAASDLGMDALSVDSQQVGSARAIEAREMFLERRRFRAAAASINESNESMAAQDDGGEVDMDRDDTAVGGMQHSAPPTVPGEEAQPEQWNDEQNNEDNNGRPSSEHNMFFDDSMTPMSDEFVAGEAGNDRLTGDMDLDAYSSDGDSHVPGLQSELAEIDRRVSDDPGELDRALVNPFDEFDDEYDATDGEPEPAPRKPAPRPPASADGAAGWNSVPDTLNMPSIFDLPPTKKT